MGLHQSLLIIAATAAVPAGAANLFVDLDPSSASIDGGTASWDDAIWKVSADAQTGSSWVDGSTAILGAIAGSPSTTALTLSGTVSAAGVSFNSAGYSLSGGTLSLAGGNDWFTVNADASIASALAAMRFRGSAEISISGGGTGLPRIILGNGEGTLVTVRQTAGTYSTSDYLMVGGNNVANSQGRYIIDGGTLTVASGTYLGWGHATSAGTIIQNAGTVTLGGQGLQFGIGGGTGAYQLNGGTLDSYFGNNSSSGSFVFGGGTLRAAANFTVDAVKGVTTTIAAGKAAVIDTNGRNVTWSTELTGLAATGLQKSGQGILQLNANFTGDVTITAGLLRPTTATSLGTGTVTVTDVPQGTQASAGGGIDLNGLSFSNAFRLGDRSSGPGDTGVIQNSAAGTTSVLTGNISIGGENYGGGPGNITFSGTISGGKVTHYAFYKLGAGTWRLEATDNSFEGFWYQAGGVTEVVKLGNLNEVSSLGRATTLANNQIRFAGDGGALRFIGSAASSSDRTFVLQGNASAASNRIEASGTNAAAALTLTGNLTAGSGYTLTLGGSHAGTNTFAGTLGAGTNLSLLKDGATTWRLTAANTYTGSTTVAAGRLEVNGSLGSGTVTVQTGASLGGTGSIAGAVNVQAGGFLAPGNSPGILQTGNLTVSGMFDAEIAGAARGVLGYDSVGVTGSVTLGADSELAVTLLNGFRPARDSLYFLIVNDGSDSVVGTFKGLADGSTFRLGDWEWQISYVANYLGEDTQLGVSLGTFTGGNDVALVAVPEPSAYAMGLGALLLALAACRRRR